MNGFLQSARRLLERLRRLPLIGSLAEDLITMTFLAADHRRGAYPKLPRATLLTLTAALIYAFSPIDLILDVIPIAGLLDDAAIIGLLVDLGLARDLTRYRAWQREQTECFRREQVDHFLHMAEDRVLAAAFLTEDAQVKLYFSRREDNRRPLPCRVVVFSPDRNRLDGLGFDSWSKTGEFYSQVFRDGAFAWSPRVRQSFMPEKEYETLREDFVPEEG